MATPTLLKEQGTSHSTSVFLKLNMAWTGALFVFYVLMHMYGNLKLFAGQETFDEYAHHLRTMLMPILPYEGFLWLFRALLVLALVIHAYAAFTLWSRAKGARANRYVVKRAVAASLSSKMMRWGGVTLLLFVIFHLIQFTVPKVNFNGAHSTSSLEIDGVLSPYRLVVSSFQLWWVVLIYVLAVCALGMHLRHGVWSALQTMGWTNSVKSRRYANALGYLIGAVVAIGFALPPLSILFGMIKMGA